MTTGERVEIEAKYRVSVAGGADGFLVAPQIGEFKAAGAVRSLRVDDRYVDTTDWALARAGFAARLRKTPDGTEISLKARRRPTGKLHRREEIEGPADAGLIPSDWPASQARNVVLELCGDQALVPFLTIRQLRRVRRLEAGEARAELSVDEVEIFYEDRSLDRFEEIEVELRRGDESVLGSIVAALDGSPNLQMERASKLDRALAALAATLPAVAARLPEQWRMVEDVDGAADPTAGPGKKKKDDGASAAAAKTRPGHAPETARDATRDRPKNAPVTEPARAEPATTDSGASAGAGVESEEARPPKLGPRTLGVQAVDTNPEAARKILAYHFGKLRSREAAVRNGVPADDLHDMRVAARRMRAAWRIFEGSFKPGRTRKIRRHLRTLADQLGAVRDLDVLIESLDAYRQGLDDSQRAGLDPLASIWRRERSDARKALLAELDSPAYTAFLKDMEDFLESGANSAATVASPTSPHRVKDTAPSRIWTSFEAVRVYELVLPWADVETLHALRIETKWLRYSLEFFVELLGPDGPRLLERVVALQDHLGLLHDADVAAKLVRDVLVSRAGELSREEQDTIGAFLHSRERELARRRRTLGPVWRAVDGAPFRRALGRSTASL